MKTDENITISRNVLMRLIKRNRQLIYMNFFLVHLCAIRNIDLVFVADEVCSQDENYTRTTGSST